MKNKYLLAALLIIVPLYPKFPFIKVPGTYVAIRLEDILLFIIGFAVIFKVLPNLKTFLGDKIVKTFLIFFGVGLVSLLSGILITHTVVPTVGLFHWIRRIEYAVPFFAAITLLSKEEVTKNISFYTKILMIVVFITFIYGLGQRYFSFPMIITQNEEYSKGVALLWTPGSHINSTFAGHYDLAAFMVMTLPIFISTFYLLKDKVTKILLLIVTGGGLWLLINSLSRIAQVSYIVSLGVSLFLAKKFKNGILFILVSLILIAMSSNLEARFIRVFDVYYKKLTSYISITVKADEVTSLVKKSQDLAATPAPMPIFEDRSTSIRLNVEWPRAIRAFVKNPLLGTGYSSIGLATDNDYIRSLAETGVLGLLAFGLVFITILKELFKVFPLNNKFSGVNLGFFVGVVGSILGAFSSALFLDLFEASKFAILFWFMLGFAVYMARNITNEQKI